MYVIRTTDLSVQKYNIHANVKGGCKLISTVQCTRITSEHQKRKTVFRFKQEKTGRDSEYFPQLKGK